MESILTSVKKDLGIMEEYEHFDPDIIMDINVAFSILTQIGVGPSEGFFITDKTSVWTDFIPESAYSAMVKKYVSMKTKVLFDNNGTGAVIDALEREIIQMEWRLNVAVDPAEDENG